MKREIRRRLMEALTLAPIVVLVIAGPARAGACGFDQQATARPAGQNIAISVTQKVRAVTVSYSTVNWKQDSRGVRREGVTWWTKSYQVPRGKYHFAVRAAAYHSTVEEASAVDWSCR